MKASKRTAIARSAISKPLRWILENGHWSLEGRRVFHQGPGRPDNPDRDALRSVSKICLEYDPNWGPRSRKILGHGNCSRAVSIYVLNVLPPRFRYAAMRDLRDTASKFGVALIAVRRKIKGSTAKWDAWADGWLTGARTFQRVFTPRELRDLARKYFHEIGVSCSDDDTVLIEARYPRRKET